MNYKAIASKTSPVAKTLFYKVLYKTKYMCYDFFKEFDMKKIIFCILLLCAVCTFSFAKEGCAWNKSSKTGVGIDYALVGRNNKFGISAALTSPWLIANSLGFRANTEYFFPNKENRNGFFVLDCSVMGGHIMKTANIRLYGGGGALFLFPMKDGEPKAKYGGHGFFGFEYFMDETPVGLSLFTEIGGGNLGFCAKAGLRYTIPIR